LNDFLILGNRIGFDIETMLNATDVRVLLAANMKRYREAFGLSQMELAEKIGCSPTLIGKIEIMRRFPSADNLNRIAAAFKVDPADLFSKTDESEMLKAVKSQQDRKALLKKQVLKAIDEAF
jgi:transcriptional regulator with XRE-family HTH domain